MDHPYRNWRLTGVAAVLLLVLAGILVAVAQSGTLSDEDREALLNAASERTGSFTTVAITVTTVGNTAAMAVLAVIVGGVLWWRGRRPEAIYAIGGMATASLVFTLVKRVLDRPRPPTQLQVIRESNESLPSGHATMSAAVIGSLVILAWPHLAALGRTLWTLAAIVWVGAVGTTRIYLGVHWLSDVLAGWALGLGWTAACAAVLFWWHTRTPEGVNV